MSIRLIGSYHERLGKGGPCFTDRLGITSVLRVSMSSFYRLKTMEPCYVWVLQTMTRYCSLLRAVCQHAGVHGWCQTEGAQPSRMPRSADGWRLPRSLGRSCCSGCKAWIATECFPRPGWVEQSLGADSDTCWESYATEEGRRAWWGWEEGHCEWSFCSYLGPYPAWEG